MLNPTQTTQRWRVTVWSHNGWKLIHHGKRGMTWVSVWSNVTWTVADSLEEAEKARAEINRTPHCRRGPIIPYESTEYTRPMVLGPTINWSS